MELLLKDKHIVITGGTKGIGLSTAKGFLAEGARVHIIARNADNDAVNELKTSYPSRVFFYQCDAVNEENMNIVLQAIKQNAASGIDVVVANVGSGKSQIVPISESEQWKKTWDTNFTTALNCARTFSPELTLTKGVLIFISSIAGLEFIGAPTDYTTAKSAIHAFAKSLSYRLAPDVRVNVVAPGNIWIKDGTWDRKMNEDPQKFTNMLNEKVPLKRLGQAKEVSDLVLFLSSPRASFITGALFVVDGGQTTSFK